MAMKSEIEAALHAHAAWRERFKDILNGRAPFDLAIISDAHLCALGKWLDSEGNRMIPSELHSEICVVHTEFHQIAAGIIQMIRDKRYPAAHEAIALDGPLNQTSLRLRGLLVKLSFREPPVASKPSPLDEAEAGEQVAGETLAPPAVEALQPED